PVNKRAQVVQGWQLKDDGVKDRVFKQKGYTAIGIIAGDGIVEEKLRTQVNAFPISTRKHLAWELKFRMGGRNLSTPWHKAPVGESSATVWQLKTPGYGPTLLMGVDSDAQDKNKLEISFDARVNPQLGGQRLGQLAGIDPDGENHVRIEAFLDEREASQGGKGILKITVNGKVIVDKKGPNVQAGATQPYNWSAGMYLWRNTVALPYDRFIYFKTLRLIDLD
ncbi:hypothetical protein EGI20_17955, partial [Aquitalea sp. S1-19]|nr:hypothetical protein [Aquitalea sp. S1-19]